MPKRLTTSRRILPSTFGVVTLAIEFAKAETGAVHPDDFERYWLMALTAYRKVDAAIVAGDEA